MSLQPQSNAEAINSTNTNLKPEPKIEQLPSKVWKVTFLFLLAFTCSSVFASIEVTDLGTLGGQWSDAYAINDHNQIVGLSETSSGASHTFLFQNGQMSDLYPLNGQLSEPIGLNNSGQVASGVIGEDGHYYPAVYDIKTDKIMIPGSLGGTSPDGTTGAATAINDARQVVGYSYIPSGEWHAFMYNSGVMQDLGSLPADTRVYYAYALGINSSGLVVGGSGSQHAFVYSNGAMAVFEPPNSDASRAYGINSRGQATGYYYKENVGRGFLYSGNQFIPIGPSQSPYTVGFAINEQGIVVGASWLPDHDSCRTCYQPRAFAFTGEQFIDLNDLLPAGSEWTLRYAYGINNNGKIIGQGVIRGEEHAFLLEISSEPAETSHPKNLSKSKVRRRIHDVTVR